MRGLKINPKLAKYDPMYKKYAAPQPGAAITAREKALENAARGGANNLLSDDTITGAGEQTTFQSDKTDWWNSFNNAIDEIDKSNYSGKRKPFELKIDQLSKEIEELESTKHPANIAKAQEKRKELAGIEQDPEYQTLNDKIRQQELDIEDSPVDTDYSVDSAKYQQEENSSMYNFLKYELPQELGGSASEIGTQLATTYGPKLVNSLVKKALVSANAGPYAPAIMGALTAAEIGTGLYGLWKMRDAESDAEVNDAYEQKVAMATDELRASKGGIEPSEAELRDIRIAAHKGLEDVKAQNMNLMLGDALEILTLGRFGVLEKFGEATRTGRAIKTATGGVATAYSEGMEETDQYGIKAQYLAGKYNDSNGFDGNALESLKGRLSSMNYALTDTSGEGYEQDPEYRNAFRSGAILGGLMGGMGTVGKLVGDERKYSKTIDEIKKLTPAMIKQEKADYRANLYTKYFAKDDGHFLIEGLTKLSQNEKDPAIKAALQEEIVKASQGQHLYNNLKEIHKTLSPEDLAKTYNKAQHLASSIEDAQADDNELSKERIIRVNDVNKLSENPSYNEAMLNRARLEAIKQNLDEYQALDENDKPSNIKEYEKILEDKYKEALNDYTNVLGNSNITEKEVQNNIETINPLIEVERARINNELVRSDLRGHLAHIHTKPGANYYLKGGAKTTTKGTDFDIKDATVETYKKYEDQQLAKQRIRTRTNKIEREAFQNNIDTRLNSDEGLENILEDVNTNAPKLGETASTLLEESILEKEYGINAEKEELAELEKAVYVSKMPGSDPMTDEEIARLQELRTKDYTKFEKEAEAFKKNLPFFKEEIKPATENKIKRNIKESFFKGFNYIKDKYEKNPEYSDLKSVTKEIERLENLKKIYDERTDLEKDSKEFEGFADDLDAKIAELKAIQDKVEERIGNREARDIAVTKNQTRLVLNQIGLNPDKTVVEGKENINEIVLSIVGDTEHKAILDDADEVELVHANILVQLLKDNMTDRTRLQEAIEEAKEVFISKIKDLPFVASKIGINDAFKRYIKNPEIGFSALINNIKDGVAGAIDDKRGGAVKTFLKEKDLAEFIVNVEKEDRTGSKISQEELLTLIDLHLNYTSLFELERNLDSQQDITTLTVSERDLEKAESEKPKRETPTPSNQQGVSIRQLYRFVKTKSTGSGLFDNVAYLKGYAGTGKTTVVIRWVFKLLGLNLDEIYTAGHSENSAKGISTSLKKTSFKTADELLADIPTMNDKIKLIILDEAPGVPTPTMEAISKALQEKNKTRKEPIKMILMGDPNQKVANGKIAAIDTTYLLPGLENMTQINPLTIVFRTDVAPIVDVQDLFKDQNEDLTRSTIHVRGNTLTPTTFTGSLIGVNGSKNNFDTDVIAILKARKADTSRTRAIIVGNEADVQKYEALLAANGITGVSVITDINAQGRTINEVYVNIPYSKVQYKLMSDYNSTMYTATSRATDYLYIGSFDVQNSISDKIEDNKAKREEDNKNRSEKFLTQKEKELETIDNFIDEIASAPKEEKEPDTEEPLKTEEPTGDGKEAEVIGESNGDLEVQEDYDSEEEYIEIGDEIDFDNPETIDIVEGKGEAVVEIVTSAKVDALKYPTGASIAKLTKDGYTNGIKVGDEVHYVKVMRSKNKVDYPVILIVAPVVGQPGRFYEVGMVSQEEIATGVSKQDTLYEALQDALNQEDELISAFNKSVGGTIIQISPTIPIFKGKVSHAQKLTYVYGRKPTPFSFRTIIDRFIETFFTADNIKNKEGIYNKARVRIYSDRAIAQMQAKYEKLGGLPFTPAAGIPYLELSGLEQNGATRDAKLQFIRLTPAKLNNIKHEHLTKDVIKLIGAIETMQQFVGDSFEFGNPQYGEMIRATDEYIMKVIKNLPNVNEHNFDDFNDLRKEIHDLVYTKELEFFKDEDSRIIKRGYHVSHNVETKAFEGTGRVTKVNYDATKNPISAVVKDSTGKSVTIPIEELIRVAVEKRKAGPAQRALNAIAKANKEINGIPLRMIRVVPKTKGTGNVKVTSAKGLLVEKGETYSLEQLKGIMAFDADGNSTGYVPLSLEDFTEKGSTITNLEDYLQDDFTGVLPHSISIATNSAIKGKVVPKPPVPTPERPKTKAKTATTSRSVNELKKEYAQEIIPYVWERLAAKGIDNADSIIGTRGTIETKDSDKFWSNVEKEDLQRLVDTYEANKYQQLKEFEEFGGEGFNPSTGNLVNDDTSYYDKRIREVNEIINSIGETKTAVTPPPSVSSSNATATLVSDDPATMFPETVSKQKHLQKVIDEGVFPLPGRQIQVKLDAKGKFISTTRLDESGNYVNTPGANLTPTEYNAAKEEFNKYNNILKIYKSPVFKKLAKLAALLGDKYKLKEFLDTKGRENVGTTYNDISNYIPSLSDNPKILPKLEAILDAEIARIESGVEPKTAVEEKEEAAQFEEAVVTENTKEQEDEEAKIKEERAKQRALRKLGNSLLKERDTSLGYLVYNPYEIIRKIIPSISRNDVRVISEAAMLKLTEGKAAWGHYKDGIIYLLKGATGIHIKVARHEAFHRIFNTHLTERERGYLIETAKRINPALKNETDVKIEEWLAEEYQNWTTKTGRISLALINIFKKILKVLGLYEANFNNIESTFDAIDAGLLDKRGEVVANTARNLIKIREDYPSTAYYRDARNSVVRNMSNLINATDIDPKTGRVYPVILNKDSSNLKAAVPMSFEEALHTMRERYARNLKNTINDLAKETDPEEIEFLTYDKELYTLLTDERKTKDLLKDIYPTLYLGKKEFTDVLADIDEDLDGNDPEIVNSAEDILEADRVDHEKQVRRSVKDFLATIIDEEGKIVNPRMAYLKLLEAFSGVDTTDFAKMRRQLAIGFGKTIETNPKVKAVHDKLLDLINKSDTTMPDEYGNLLPRFKKYGFEFTDQNTFVYLKNGSRVTINRGSKASSFFITEIKNAIDSMMLEKEISYSTINSMYKREIARETLRDIRSSIGSLRRKNVMIAVRVTTLWDSEEQREISAITYRYNSVREQGAKQNVRAAIETAFMTKGGELSKGLRERFDKTDNSKTEQAIKNIKDLVRELGLGEVTVLSSNAQDIHASLKDLLVQFDSIGKGEVTTEETTIDGDEGEKTKEILTWDRFLKDSNERLEKLTDLIAQDNEGLRPVSYTSGDGTKRYEWMNSSFGIDTLINITRKELEESTPEFLNSNSFKNNAFIVDKENAGSNTIHSFIDHDSIKEQDNKYKPTPYKGESQDQWMQRNINYTFTALVKNRSAAKGIRYIQQFFTISNKPQTIGAEIDLKDMKGIKGLIENAIKQQIDRKEFDIDNYNNKKNFLPGISAETMSNLKKVSTTEAWEDTLNDAVEDVYKALENISDNLTQHLFDSQFVLDYEVSKVITKLLPYIDAKYKNEKGDELLEKHNIKYGTRSVLDKKYNLTKDQLLPLIDLWSKNSYMNGLFLNQLVMGDQAFYKSTADQIKRMSIGFAMGYTGMVNNNGFMNETFHVAVVEKLKFNINDPKYAKYKKFFGLEGEVADAQGFALPRRKANIDKGFGKEMGLGNTMKPVYWSIDKDGIPRGMKYGLIVLSDELLYHKGDVNGKPRFPELIQLRKEMEAARDGKGVDELVFHSAFKIGAPKHMTSTHPTSERLEYKDAEGNMKYGINPDSIVELENKNWRIQLNPIHKLEGLTSNPTQLTYFVNFNGINQKAADKLFYLNSKLINRGLNKISARLGKGNGDEDKIREIVAEGMGNSDARQHEFLTAKDEDGNILSINFPTLVNKMVTQIASTVSKASVQIKYNGSKLVLQADYGVTFVDNLGKRRKLQFRKEVRKEEVITKKTIVNENGEEKVVITKEIVDRTVEYAEVLMDNIYKDQFKVGDVLFETNLGFRIPSTELHSAIPIKIVGFYDGKGTNVVIAPREITVAHGSDYDIDALFIMRRTPYLSDKEIKGLLYENAIIGYNKKGKKIKNYISKVEKEIKSFKEQMKTAEKEGKMELHAALKTSYKILDNALDEAIKNEIVDTFLEVITAERNAETMMTPISMARLNDVNSPTSIFSELKEIGVDIEREYDLNNPLDQMKIHKDNFSGTALVGAIADLVRGLAYVYQSLPEGKVPILADTYTLEYGDKKFNTLERKEYNSKEIVSETLDALINAALDNVKEQILPIINLTNSTGKAYFGMLATGMPLLDTVKQFLTPAIVHLGSARNVGFEIDTISAEIEGLIKEKGKEKTVEELLALRQDTKITSDVLDKMVNKKLEDLTLEQLIVQDKVLENFKKADRIGEEVGKVSKITKILKQLPVTQEEIQDMVDDFNSLEKTKSVVLEGVDVLKIPHIKAARKALTKVHDIVNNQFYKHRKEINDIAKLAISKTGIKLDKNVNTNRRMIRDEVMKMFISGITYTDLKATGSIIEEFTIDMNPAKEPMLIVNDTRELVGINAFNQRFAREVLTMQAKYPNNRFLKALRIAPELGAGTDMFQVVFNTTAALEPVEIQELQNSFNELSEIPGVFTEFQHKFVKYAALNQGLSFGVNSFSLLLPVEIYKQFDKAFNDFFDVLLDKDNARQPDVVKKRMSNTAEYFALKLAELYPDKLARNNDFVKNPEKPKYPMQGIDKDKADNKVHYEIKFKHEVADSTTQPEPDDTKEENTEDPQNIGTTQGEKDVEIRGFPLFMSLYKKSYIRLESKVGDDFVYYQFLNELKKGSTLSYEFNREIMFSGYGTNDVFRRNIKTRSVVKANEQTEYKGETKYNKFEVGDTINLRTKTDSARRDSFDYEISSVQYFDTKGNEVKERNNDGTVIYSLENGRKVLAFDSSTLKDQDFKDYKHLC